MCGIAGIIGNREDREELLQEMLDAMHFRGPDGKKNYLGEEVAFGHVRLSIVDIEKGEQPIFNENKRLVGIVNGEIFNYKELAELLKNKNHILHSASDSEVILHLYEEYGLEFVKKLDGQFALAIWDMDRKILLLSRDKLGEKPLFYYRNEGIFYFSSDVNSLRKTIDNTSVNIACLKDICTTWGPVHDHTLYSQICSVGEGELLVVREGEILSEQKYFEIAFQPKKATQKKLNELEEELEKLLINSIDKRIPNEVNSAFYLSGGLDSSIIIAIASRLMGMKLNTFSIAFEETQFDESPYQKIVSDYFGTKHNCVNVSSSRIEEKFTDIIKMIGMPVVRAGVFPMYFLSEAVAKRGYKVALSGEGADELFGGYDVFKESLVRKFCEQDMESEKRPKLYRRLNAFASGFQNNTGNSLALYYNQVKTEERFSSHVLRWRFGDYCRQFIKKEVQQEWDKYDLQAKLAKGLPDGYEQFSMLQKAQYLEIKTLMSQYLLSAQGDRVSMANSLECRYPFLDQAIIQFAFELPDLYKIYGMNEKYILKRLAYKYLPKEIIQRNKFPYRATIQMASLLKREEIQRTISKEAIDKCGIFNPVAVERFLGKIRNKNTTTEKEFILCLFLLSTQIILME